MPLFFLIHATSILLINTLFSFLKERANTWLLHQKSEDFSVGHFKFFCSTGVQSYNGKPIFQQSTLSLPVISTWWTLFHRRQFVFVGKHYWHIIEQSRWKYIKIILLDREIVGSSHSFYDRKLLYLGISEHYKWIWLYVTKMRKINSIKHYKLCHVCTLMQYVITTLIHRYLELGRTYNSCLWPRLDFMTSLSRFVSKTCKHKRGLVSLFNN